ncbi:MAG: zinc ribbon domain-containing protein [Bacilli bacterium]|nr:zinc ribbon domain-containing protein [Bacilli bacterium]
MAKKFCTSCGNELEKGTLFCTKCGAKIEELDANKEKSIEEETVQEENIENTYYKKKSHKGLIITIIIIILLALLGFLLWFFVFKDDNKEKSLADKIKEEAEKIEKEVKEEIKKHEDELVEIEPPKEAPKEFYGYLYQINGGFGWAKSFNDDKDYYYLLNDKGKVIKKIDYVYYEHEPVFKQGYSQILDNIYDTKGEVVFKKEGTIDKIEYAGEGFVIVTTKDESYKGTVYKQGIYDINNKSYNLEPDENVTDIRYYNEGMFMLRDKETSGYSIYNTETKTKFYLDTRFDVVFGEYRDSYIVYRDINSESVYLLDKKGNKTLVSTDGKWADLGQYSDGLVFVRDAFYDGSGTKVIDLKDEGVNNIPEFKNGYALLYFETGYFTILSKETGKYMFEPRAYTKLGRYHSDDYELGIYEGQNQISKTGHILVKTNGNSQNWAIMDVNGRIIITFPEGMFINSPLSDDGYVGISNEKTSYYMDIKGKKITINE